MKLQLSTRIVSIIGIIILTLYFPPGGARMGEVYGMDPGSSIDGIDLEIESLIDLGSTSSIEFIRDFSLSEKREVYLLHIDVEASENTVDDVIVNANINNVTTMVVFEDSGSNYKSSNSFFGGTRLSFQIDPTTPISVLSNTLILTIDVVSSSLFGELGTFQVKSATLELITTPTIDSDSVKTPVPMENSRGSWYIAPLSTLNQRKLESKLFTNITDDLLLRLDIDVTPTDYALSTTDFKVSNGSSTFESVSSGSNSMQSTIYANLTQGDSLVLEFTFRPKSDLANSVVQLEVKVEATPVTIIPDSGPSGTDQETSEIDVDFLNLGITDLELIRFSMIVIPIFLYFNRSKKRNKSKKSEYIQKGDLFGTNEE